jgi:hypothetical protein
MPSDVRPYFVPADGTVSWEPWVLHDGQTWIQLPDAVEGWDPGTDLRVARRVVVDAVQFRAQTGLDLSNVAVAVSWTSSTTDMTESTMPVPFGIDGSAVVDALLVGERLSGILTLRSTVSLVRKPSPVQVGVASILGSVLAEHVQQLGLESLSSMFPVHEIDFANTRLSPSASWHLETSTDLASPFYGTFRVLINKRDKELSSAVARGAKDKRQQALLDELESGVAALLLELSVAVREELDEREEWPVDTVGDVLSRLLEASQLSIGVPTTAQDLADFRTQVAGAVRRTGRGRIFL